MAITVVIAPDSFKGSLDAATAARAIARGWRAERPHDTLHLMPQADGGEGTLQVLTTAIPGSTVNIARGVTGPDGRAVDAPWLLLPDGTAVVELAASSGLPLMAHLDPRGAHTRGLGEVIGQALNAGATALIVALGGSASTDGGAGALEALGLRLTDAAGSPVPAGGGGLAAVADINRAALTPAPSGGVTLLTDVRNPLLGPTGAAAVFGPQKGANAADVAALEAGLAHFAAMLGGDPLALGSGAAGGTAFGLATIWNARLAAGAPVVARLSGLAALAPMADVVVTGEGSFDAQSTTGKSVGHVLSLAPRRSVVIAGRIAAPVPDLGISLTELAGSSELAMSDAARWLEAAGVEAARALTPTFLDPGSSQ